MPIISIEHVLINLAPQGEKMLKEHYLPRHLMTIHLFKENNNSKKKITGHCKANFG